MVMKGEQYDALVKLMRGDADSPGNRAARRVLVDGVTQAEAMRETGAIRSSVSNAVSRYADADGLMRDVYGVNDAPTGKLKPYSLNLDGVHDVMVAATSQSAAAKLIGTSVYMMRTYDAGYSDEDEALALSEPGQVFRKKGINAQWVRWTPPKRKGG